MLEDITDRAVGRAPGGRGLLDSQALWHRKTTIGAAKVSRWLFRGRDGWRRLQPGYHYACHCLYERMQARESRKGTNFSKARCRTENSSVLDHPSQTNAKKSSQGWLLAVILF